MENRLTRPRHQTTSRRRFLTRSATLAGLGLASSLAGTPPVHAAGSDTLPFGLIGCGGRGIGAALNAMNAGPDVKLVAIGELFEDRLHWARERLTKLRPSQVALDKDHCFSGFDAYQRVIDSEVEIVLIAAASHFHPLHFKAAVDAGKHVFCEKPHGIDVPGLKSSIATCAQAKEKRLSVVSGLCWRYDPAVRETIERVRDGAIGAIVAIEENYLGGPYIVRERQPEWNELEYQFRNWYHFNWLSGDQTSQQLIHSLDKASWALGDQPPGKAWGLGGRQTCVDPKYGDQFDHHSVTFEYDHGVRVFGFCRDMPGCFSTTSDIIMGTKGRALLPSNCRIEGATNWSYQGPKADMYDLEQKELFDSIRAGQPLNNGDFMCTSTMLGILAQMVCYTGQEITWDQAMQSELSFSLGRYDWDVQPPIKPGPDGRYGTAMPGITQYANWPSGWAAAT